MSRFQNGYVYEASGIFFVRYTQAYSDLPPEERARIAARCEAKAKPLPARVLVSQRLCVKDDKHHSRTCKPVKKLAAEFMKSINDQAASVNHQTVCDFWNKVYLPFIVENKRYSTVHGYKQVWADLLKDHFGNVALKDYRTPQGTVYLTSLAKKYGQRTLQHIRSLASGIFSHAVAVGELDSNPWHDVKILGKVRQPEDTKHYTLREAEDIISALIDDLEAQCVMALAFFLGLRPGEIEGLRWEDVNWTPDTDGLQWVHIRRAVVRGVVGPTKTKDSVAFLPLIAPVLVPLTLWHRKSGGPVEGWVFPNSKDKPRDLRTVTRRIVKLLKAAGLEFKTLYAGRRGAGTILTELTKDALAAKELLRHKTITTTTNSYVKQIPEALLKGIRLLEAAAGQPDTAEDTEADSVADEQLKQLGL